MGGKETEKFILKSSLYFHLSDQDNNYAMEILFPKDCPQFQMYRVRCFMFLMKGEMHCALFTHKTDF